MTPPLTPPLTPHRTIGPADLFLHALSYDPDQPFVEFADGSPTVTKGMFRRAVAGHAAALQSLDLAPAARVGMLARNRVEVLYIQAAATFTGLCLVALHPMASVDDLVFVAQDAGFAALIYDADYFAPVAEALAQRLPELRLFAMGEGPGENLSALAEANIDAPLVAPEPDLDTIVRMTYSGGTTGKPKAITGTLGYAMALQDVMLKEWEWPREIRQLVCSPLSHAGGAVLMPVLLKGGTLVVMPAFEPGAVLAAIEKFRITSTLLVPAMIYALLDHPDCQTRDTSSLEVIAYGASSINPVRLAEAIERFGPVFFQFYGQAEAPMSITLLRRADHDPSIPGRLSSCGRPTPWNQVALLDDANNPVPQGEPGEICVRGPMIMSGYLNRPEETAEAFVGGWLHTGDIAKADADGFLTIVDRKKDMIVSGGFNVYPREIEDVLAEQPGVADVVVIGVPHDKWGEAVTAVIVPRSGVTFDTDALVAIVRERKGAHYAPKAVHIVEAIPRTGLGKPDKKALRAIYAA